MRADKICLLCGYEHTNTIGKAMSENSTVAAALQLHFNNDCISYEQALILAIVHLVRENEELRYLIWDTIKK